MRFQQISDLTLNGKYGPTMEAEAGGLNPIWISMQSSRHSEVNVDLCSELVLNVSPRGPRLLFHSDPRPVTRRLRLTVRCSEVTGPHQAVSQVAETGYQTNTGQTLSRET